MITTQGAYVKECNSSTWINLNYARRIQIEEDERDYRIVAIMDDCLKYIISEDYATFLQANCDLKKLMKTHSLHVFDNKPADSDDIKVGDEVVGKVNGALGLVTKIGTALFVANIASAIAWAVAPNARTALLILESIGG